MRAEVSTVEPFNGDGNQVVSRSELSNQPTQVNSPHLNCRLPVGEVASKAGKVPLVR